MQMLWKSQRMRSMMFRSCLLYTSREYGQKINRPWIIYCKGTDGENGRNHHSGLQRERTGDLRECAEVIMELQKLFMRERVYENNRHDRCC